MKFLTAGVDILNAHELQQQIKQIKKQQIENERLSTKYFSRGSFFKKLGRYLAMDRPMIIKNGFNLHG